ncbi:Hypothetical protein, putative [Bodo saltans]|uniref:Membrane-associated protein n=1 Tax=Bodo saltans TaxID=75058 RepID=A0A0S4ITW6_BODSA|nr:Hypothetical protein, putative [Bodo saltans]|eukprot:CUF86239.1 Hypothetical protein, putative [Bodo saltans]
MVVLLLLFLSFFGRARPRSRNNEPTQTSPRSNGPVDDDSNPQDFAANVTLQIGPFIDEVCAICREPLRYPHEILSCGHRPRVVDVVAVQPQIALTMPPLVEESRDERHDPTERRLHASCLPPSIADRC